MRLKHLIGGASLALALAITACSITTSSDSCAPDVTVTGCTQGSSGYSCTGTASPSSSLNCGSGVSDDAGSTLYCCIPSSTTVTTCAPDTTVSNCPGTSQGYSCTGSDTPPQGYPSLSCGAGIPGNAGSTLFCCATGGADAGGTCAPDANVAGCVGSSTGYSCTGSNAPPQTNSSLGCGPGLPGDGGSTVYCCMSSASGADGGGDVAAEGGADASVDAAGSEAGTEGGSDAAASDGGSGAAVSDGGSDAVADAENETGVDGGACSVMTSTGSASCEQCMQSLCCTALVACGTADDAGVDDAGNTACEAFLTCTLDCVSGNPEAGVDGGSVSDCESSCGPPYTQSEQQSASAILQCQTTNCPTQCQ